MADWARDCGADFATVDGATVIGGVDRAIGRILLGIGDNEGVRRRNITDNGRLIHKFRLFYCVFKDSVL